MNATMTRDTTTTPPTETPDELLYVGRRMTITLDRLTTHYGWGADAARKMIERGGVGTEARVFVVGGNSESMEDLPHYPFHSPSGFEWAYHGSGPAELARCILLHHCGLAARKPSGSSWCEEVYDPESGEPAELPVSYQEFKADVISKLDRRGFELRRSVVVEWIKGRRHDR